MNRKRVLHKDVIGQLVVHIPFALEFLPLGEVVITTILDIDIACGKTE